MNEAEKADLILKEVYESECNEYTCIITIAQKTHIPVRAYKSLHALAENLYRDKLIKLLTGYCVTIKLTPEDIKFCEYSSFAYPGYPIVTHKRKRLGWR